MGSKPPFASLRKLVGVLSEPERKGATLEVGRGSCNRTWRLGARQQPSVGSRKGESRDREWRRAAHFSSPGFGLRMNTSVHRWTWRGIRICDGHSIGLGNLRHWIGSARKGSGVSRQSSWCLTRRPHYPPPTAHVRV